MRARSSCLVTPSTERPWAAGAGGCMEGWPVWLGSHAGRTSVALLIAFDVVAMLGLGLGKRMTPIVAGNKVIVVGVSWCDDRFQGVKTGAADWSGRQAAIQVGVERRGSLEIVEGELRLPESVHRRLGEIGAGYGELDGRVGPQRHADLQAVDIDAGDDRALGWTGCLALED